MLIEFQATFRGLVPRGVTSHGVSQLINSQAGCLIAAAGTAMQQLQQTANALNNTGPRVDVDTSQNARTVVLAEGLDCYKSAGKPT